MIEKQIEDDKRGNETNLVSLPSQQVVIPNSQEIDLSNKCNHKIVNMPYAVKSFKFDKRNLDKFNFSNVSEQRKGYEEICKKYPNTEFLLHIQVAERTKFTNENMKFIEEVQNTNETPFFCLYEKSYEQTENELQSQIMDAKKEHPKKEIVPAVEVFTIRNVEKVNVMKRLGIKKCIIIYRNYQIYDEEWKNLMWALDSVDISRFVFGVSPRMRRKNKASILLAPLRFGANYVAHGLPWSGGKGQVYLLGNNWVYNVTQKATYPLSRVEALNKVNTLTSGIPNLTIKQIETLLY